MVRHIPYSRQEIDEADIAAVTHILRSDFITQGPAVGIFEAALMHSCNAAHAVAVSSATAGLHLICLAMGIGPGDIVWTSPISFVASSNCALYVGAMIDFVDIDPLTGNMDTDALEWKLDQANTNNCLPKLIIPVHFTGRSCDMVTICELARKYGIFVVEDAAHALGATYRDHPVGNCSNSDATIFSFHPVKSITTGEGGAIMTNNGALAEKIRLLRSHGITRDPDRMEAKDQDAWYYEMQELGYHYRLTDIQAALGESQLKKLGRFMARRREIAQYYSQALAGLPLLLPPDNHGQGNESAWHLYVIRLLDKANISRSELFGQLRSRGIGVNVHYIPIHLQPYYQRLGFKPGDFPQAEAFYSSIVSLPVFPTMTDDEQCYVIQALTEILS